VKKAMWIAMLLLFAGETAGYAKTMSIAQDKVNVRTRPSKQARVLYSAPKGFPVVVKKQTRNWLYVEDWNGKKGWVYKKMVSSIPTTII
jgi:SH3-like domain-containing protein